VILEKGVAALTLEAVAQQAGLSKGGLLYHFPNKDSLITGMIEWLIAEFDSALEYEANNHASDWLTAYILASSKADPRREKISSALFAAIANNPNLLKPLQARFNQWQKKAESSSVSPEVGTAIRLAVDGLWFSELLGFAPPTSAMRTKVVNILLKLVKESR
jgi:AcrR family transcriptional regulator